MEKGRRMERVVVFGGSGGGWLVRVLRRLYFAALSSEPKA